MNHHMFPYDEVYVRYIMAPQDYGAYAKYLGCLLARYDICYFLHEKMRPSTLVGPLYNAFLMRPDAMAATVEAQAMLDVYSDLTFDFTTGRRTTAPQVRKQTKMTMHYLDVLQGTMVHKDRVREFVDRINNLNKDNVDDQLERSPETSSPTPSLSLRDKARLADLMFVYSQPTVPTFLPHAVRTNIPKRSDTFPTAVDLEAAVAFAAKSRQLSPAGGDEHHHYADADAFVDPLSAIFTHARAPCSSGRCTFTTSINTWPKTRHTLDRQQLEDLTTGNQTKHKLEANQTYWAAVDGNLKTAWKESVPTSSSPWFVGLELPAPTLITGVRLWSKAEIKPTPILQLTYHGDLVYQPASPNLCKDGKWATEGKLKVLRFECVMPLRVTRVRLVIIQAAAASSLKPPSAIVELAEIQVDPVSSPLLDEASRFAHELAMYDANAANKAAKATGALAISQYPTAPSLGGKVVYVLQEPISELLQGTALAFVEEACEMGRLYPGNVTLVYDGGVDASIGDYEQPTATSASSSSSTSMLKALADAFAVVGSTCRIVGDDGGDGVLHMHALDDAAVGGRNDGSNRLIAWWTSDPKIAASTSLVVFTSSGGEATDDGNLLIAQLLRERDRLAPNAVFVARTFGHIAGIFQEAVNLADGVLVASQREYVTHAQGQNFKGQDIRLAYPLRMLSANPAILQTPTTPAVEEIVLLVTPATTEQDLDMFSASVAPIVQRKADVRIANVTTMQLQLSRRAGLSTDEHVMAPKWRTVKDVAYYVSIYPSRVLWILDATVGSAYYASIASIEGARFIASKLAIPHTQSRMLAWNATCEWTAEAFQGKAYELVNAKYNASSSFIDQERLRSDAFDLVIEEWPIRRLFAPFANTVAQVVHYTAELMAGHEMRKAHRLSDVESVLI
jgi:hypothetical protein